LSRGSAVFPPAALDYVLPSRGHEVSHPPGRVAVSLSSGTDMGRQHRFHIHELWRIQDVPYACRTLSAVLCITLLSFLGPDKRSQEKRKS
jgi:hypothetical protein